MFSALAEGVRAGKIDAAAVKAKAGADPSYQPVYLPFQDRTTNNHSAIWTTDIRCQDDTDCPSDYKCMMSSCTSMM